MNISVIIPLYNIDLMYLELCLNNLHLQVNQHLEFIIIDDCSTNEPINIISRFLLIDKRFKYYSLDSNQGVSAARNTGIKISQGDYLFFLDPDDFLDIDYFDRYDKFFFKKYEEYELIILGSDWTRNIENGFGIQKKINDFSVNVECIDEVKKQVIGKRNSNDQLNEVNVGAMLARFYKKEFLVKNNILCEIGVKKEQDCLFSIDFYNNSPRIIIINNIGYHYRINQNSICRKYNLEITDILFNTLQHYRKRFEITQIGTCDMQLAYKCFNILGDISLINYNHKDNTMKYSIRKKQYLNTINTSIVRNSLLKLKYSDLNINDKIKLFLLKRRLIFVYWMFLGK